MAVDIEKDFKPSAIREGVYGHPFSSATDKVGRSLLLIATVALVTAVFDVTPISTPLVPLDFSAQPDSLITFLATVNFALLMSYTLSVSNDLLRAHEDWSTAKKNIEIERAIRADETAWHIDDAIASGEPPPGGKPIVDQWWEEASDIREEAVKRIRKIEAGRNERAVPIFVRWVRLVFFGGLPLLTGLAAVAHTWRNVWHFFEAVVGL